MPLPNFHSARIQNPNLFVDDSIRTKKVSKQDGVTMLVGRPKGRSGKHSQIQAYRFDKGKHTAAQAKKWLADHSVKYQTFEPAKDATKLSRASALELARSLTFRKDTLHTGEFTGEDGAALNITSERLAEIEQAFKDMQANGVKVPIYASTHQQAFTDTHDTDDAPARVAENCIGYIGDALQDGEQLELIHEFADDEAVKIAKRVQQVSACIEPDFVDGLGRHYPHAITHVLLTPEPAVSAQSDFKEVACFSRATTEDSARMLAQAADTSDEDVRRALGKAIDAEAASAVPPAGCAVGSWVVDVYPDYFIYSMNNKHYKRGYTADAEGVVALADKAEEVIEERQWVTAPAPAQLSRKQAEGDPEMELKDLVKNLGLPDEADEAACTAEIAKLRARPEAPAQLSRDATEPLAEAAEHKLSKLITDGKITPAAGDQLRAELIGPDGARNAYALSRVVSGKSADQKALAFAVLDILNENAAPVKTGVATGLQLNPDAVMLQRPAEEGTSTPEDKQRRQTTQDEMVETASNVA